MPVFDETTIARIIYFILALLALVLQHVDPTLTPSVQVFIGLLAGAAGVSGTFVPKASPMPSVAPLTASNSLPTDTTVEMSTVTIGPTPDHG
jgi:hypothetical protein